MKMNIVFAAFLATILGLDLAQAASVTLTTTAGFGAQSDPSRQSFADGTSNGQSDSTVTDRAGAQFSTSLATFQANGDDLFAATRVVRPETGITASQTASGRGEAERTIRVATAGTLRIDLRVSGFYSITATAPGTDPFAAFMADLDVSKNGMPTVSDSFGLSSNAGPRDLTFAERLSTEIAVEAGDELSIYTGVWVSAGATRQIPAFLDVQANMDSVFSITALDGATLGTGTVAPVPLPPSLAMLGLGLAGLTRYRRARRQG